MLSVINLNYQCPLLCLTARTLVRINFCMLLIYSYPGQGVFVLNGAVEDSATAEISRSQVRGTLF